MKRFLVLFVVLTLVAGCAPPTTKSQKGARVGTSVGALVGGFAGKKIGQNMDGQEAAMRRELAAVEAANIQRNAIILAITFKSDFMFDVDSAALKPGAQSEMQRVSSVLNQFPQTSILVAGHTDSSGAESYNQELSERRAMTIKSVLVGQGVHPARMRTIGFGETAPIADNGTESGRRMNRRVVVTIKSQES